VTCQISVAASQETVFSFFTDPAKMTRWQGVAATLGPQPGGAYSIDLEDGIVMEGTSLEITPFERLVFTFGWAGHPVVSPGSTRVEVTFEPEANGTLVTLRHHDLPADERDRHASGWNHYLPRLAVAASGGDPGPHTKPSM
jgi:uncharacterized protein YndB with AHSA1/START domain